MTKQKTEADNKEIKNMRYREIEILKYLYLNKDKLKKYEHNNNFYYGIHSKYFYEHTGIPENALRRGILRLIKKKMILAFRPYENYYRDWGILVLPKGKKILYKIMNKSKSRKKIYVKQNNLKIK